MIRKKTIFSILLAALFTASLTFFYDRFYKAPEVTILGSVKMSDGLGRHPVELLQAFKGEITVGIEHTAIPCFKDIPKNIRGAIQKTDGRQGKVLIYFDSVWSPTHSCASYFNEKNPPSQIRIAYSMFESSKIPVEWVSILNTYFDAVVVPDEYHVDVYKTCGVDLPVFVLPLVVNLQECLERPLKKAPSNPFVFGNLSALTERKNQLLLIRAFHSAFQNSPDVILKINARYFSPAYKEKIQKYLDENQISNVVLTQECLSKKSYLHFLSNIDCYVSISHGEGFSIQPREAMALGIPTIVSNNTAQTTIAKSNLALSVDTPILLPAIYNWNQEESYGNWSTCTEKDLADSLKEMTNNYSSYLKAQAQARAWAAQYDFSHLKPRYKTLLKPTKVELGDQNLILSDKIITTSPTLVEKFRSLSR